MTAPAHEPMVWAALTRRNQLASDGKNLEAAKALLDVLAGFDLSSDEFARSFCLLTTASALYRQDSRDLAHVLMLSALPDSAQVKLRPLEGGNAPRKRRRARPKLRVIEGGAS